MCVRVQNKISRQFFVVCFCKNMAAPQVFVKISDDDLVKFSEENENARR